MPHHDDPTHTASADPASTSPSSDSPEDVDMVRDVAGATGGATPHPPVGDTASTVTRPPTHGRPERVSNGALAHENHQPPSSARVDGVPSARAAGSVPTGGGTTSPPVTVREDTREDTPVGLSHGPRGGVGDLERSYAAATDPHRGRTDSSTASPAVPRPTMAQLRPLLTKHAQGHLTFEDVLPLQPHDARDVVGWLYMETGKATKSIDVASAIHSLLGDNTHPDVLGSLVNIIKCERDLQKGMIRWGFATSSALSAMQGKTLLLRVRRKDKGASLVPFTMKEPHVLDGFYMDLPSGLRGRSEERQLFELLARLEPRFLWGTYLDVSATTGCAGSRYRLHFVGSTVPSTMLRDGRMVEEFVFLGRRLRVYGEGWYFKDKYLSRLDLDALGRSYGPTRAPQSTAPTPNPRPAPSTDAPKSKKGRPTPTDDTGFTVVRPRKARAANNASATAPRRPVDAQERPWTSPNAFQALAERWTLAHDVVPVTHGSTTVVTITPDPQRNPREPATVTTGEYVTCQPVVGGTPTAVEVSVDALAAAIEDLTTKAQAHLLHIPAQVDAAVTRSHFDLAKLVRTSRVDTLNVNLERYPVDFGLQLTYLFTNDFPIFTLYVRQRLLHRWMRATWGGAQSFDHLYNRTFGKKPSQGHVADLFTAGELQAGLEPMTTCDLNGDEASVSRLDVEMTLAIAEVFLAIHAPLFFGSDAALVACVGDAVGVIASHQGTRCLSTATMARVLLATQLGQEIFDLLRAAFRAPSADFLQWALAGTELAFNDGWFDYCDRDQVMMHPSEPRLVAGDLADPRGAPPAPRGAAQPLVDLSQDPTAASTVHPVDPTAAPGATYRG
jgi:hypothetical protein